MKPLRLVLAAALLGVTPAMAQEQPQPFTDLSGVHPTQIRNAFLLNVQNCHLPNVPEDRRPIITATETTGALFMPGWSKPFLEFDFERLRQVGVEGDYYKRYFDRGATVDEMLEIMTIGNLGVIFPGQPCPERKPG